MSKKIKCSPGKPSERPSKVTEDEKPDERDPEKIDQGKETAPPIGELSINNHPHLEEILD